jgi:hypothetical protein
MGDKEVYLSRLPICVYCKKEGKRITAEYDGATNSGPWAFMCQLHFGIHGVGLGTGVGQKLILVR